MNETKFSFDEWQKAAPQRLKSSPLWKSDYYQFSMYLYDLAWQDCAVLRKDFRGREIVSQLIRSIGSISANIEEGYGRGIGTADYVRILRIALGEAREAQGWYFRSRHVLPPELVEHRTNVLDQIIALLVNAISRHRKALGR